MERLTRPNLNVDQDTDRFLHAAIGGKEIDWKQSRDSTLHVLLNGPTSNGFCKDIFRKMARDLYGQLKDYEDIAELCGGTDRLREFAEADKAGRCVVLPCKVGDIVYKLITIKAQKPVILETQIKTLGQAADVAQLIGKRNKVINVFLTREEAERALQEMESRKDG